MLPNLKQVLAKLRYSDHKLRIETVRHKGLVRKLFVKLVSDGNKLIDDEYHMLIECKTWQNLE